MDRWYIYKLTFMNGCTYVGKHHQIHEKDNYVTSSSYYHKKGGKDILLKREIVLDNLPDEDTCEIMETICILHDRAENVNNVNYNKGAWMSNQFDRGFSGKENGMYGKSVESVVGKERWREIVKKQQATLRKNFEKKVENGYVPRKVRDAKKKEWNKKVREINHLIWLAHHQQEHFETKEELSKWRSEKCKKSKWYWNPTTYEEKFSREDLISKGWNRGRLPHEYWSDERKQSYKAKHNINTWDILKEKDPIKHEQAKNKCSETSKERIWYTNGVNNKYLRQGADIPEGYYKGFTLTKTEKYINSRRKRNG